MVKIWYNEVMVKQKRERQRPAIKQPTWQNPLIEYWAGKKTKPRKPVKMSRRQRLEWQIMAMLACFSISIGLWENFRQLWLLDNSLDVAGVSTVMSMGMVLSIGGILLIGKFVKQVFTKRLMVVTLAVRSVNQLLLFTLNGSGLTGLVVLSFMLDVVTGSVIITSVYPLLTGVMKSNNAYSRRKLVEYLFRDVGVLIGGILIGQVLAGVVMDYNAMLMISCLFSVVAGIIMWRLEITPTERAPESRFSAIKYVMRSKIHRMYMVYVFVSCASYHAAIGLRMLMLTGNFALSDSMATNYLLIVGLISDVLGIVALRYFTPKNDYVTMWVKFGTRLILYTLTFLSGNLFLCFVSMTWCLLSSTAYENVLDGYYINSVDNRFQLKYNTLKYVVNYAGDAAGIFLCGLMLELGPTYVFGMAGLLTVGVMFAACYLVSLRRKRDIMRK